uniref:Disease resistance protein At4g27190-like leucine-rich repeats domain-containing protein n=2 Tax=Hordeum vulgare subsp. vulgare TaxID=112509 RepID=A0A8I6W3Q0_HORVV
MAPSSWENWPNHERDKWRDYLRNIDFWFNGYYETYAYSRLVNKLLRPFYVRWNVGVGPMASFTRAISGLAVKKMRKNQRGFNPVIKVGLKPTPTAEEAQGRGIMSTKYQLAIAAAKELGQLGQPYNRLKEKHDDLQYYTYGCDDGGTSEDLEWHVRQTIVPQIIQQLLTKRYLLVVENLEWPIEPGSLALEDVGLPPPSWAYSQWLISTTSRDVYNKSKSQDDRVISILSDDLVVVLIIYAMHQSAEHIHSVMHQGSKEYWHRISLDCFHYAMTLFVGHSQVVDVTSEELIHQWATQGVIPQPHMTIKEDEETNTISSKCSHMHRVGRVILEAFHKYSLLQLPFSPATEAYEASNTGAQFFLYHGLIAESITPDELFDNKKKWISFNGDHGWHVSREWLRPEETRGPTTLILRGCSHQSLILSKLDSFLPKLCFLRVLDISYTPIKSLPSSIGCLTNLRLLSLRGCHGLKTLSYSSTISPTNTSTNTTSNSPLSTLYLLEILDMNGVPFSHLTQDVANQKWNLIHLDMSYSEITTFPPDFFEDMSNLEELILTSCSNLVELPPSMASLSSLTTLVVIGTQIKYFPKKIFEEMQKLQSLKLIDNKNLVSLTRQTSRVQRMKLEGHPSLISFMLIGAPHIRHLSLRGCKKLESIEIKNLGALEELDLSGTAIKELPADIPNIPQLRRLLLLGVPSLRRFPWHRLDRLPAVFYLDHSSEENGNHSNQISHVCVTDPKFFHSFRNTVVDLVREGRFLQSFYVRVAPCITNSMHLQDEEGMLSSMLQELVKKESTYVDVYGSFYADEIAMVPPVTIPLRRSERHMEITGKQSTLDGLRYLLITTKSITVTCASSIDYFSREIDFQELEECELHRCHKMTKVFYETNGLKNLLNLHVCDLKSLDSLCAQYYHYTFSSLEHLHLEDCPRLEHVVPHIATLPCLKTLDILFCYNLKTIFISSYTEDDTYQLPCLQRIRLQELPLLQHFHTKDATITTPVWKDLHVRGCWSLRRLPLLEGLQPEIVKVNGERSWWSKLQWGSPLHRDNYDPKLPPEFASFDERAEMSSYLR